MKRLCAKEDMWQKSSRTVESPEDVLRDIDYAEAQVALVGRKVPRSHRGIFGGRRKPQPGTENVTSEDVLPSRHRIEELIDYLKKKSGS